MTDPYLQFDTKASALGGAVLGLAINLDGADVIRTVILASVGAVVSFTISVLMRWIVKAVRRTRDPP